jgi:glycosyltransferase involved in cell wall biosynthesis
MESQVMTAPFFSVIVPVFNRASVLGAALQSVLAQTCQDFEIIVVDDGSSDNPRAVVEQVGDPRIRFVHQENQGGGTARNTGINAARGRFVAPLDSDDIFLPHHLESMKNLLDGTKGTVGYARILCDRGDGRTFLRPPRAIRAGEDMGEYVLCERGFVPTITIVVEREMAQRVRYHPKLRAAEDVDFAIRLALEGCRFHMLEQPGAVWNDHDDPARASARNRAEEFGAWLSQMRTHLTANAWRGGRGWPYAKMLAHNGRKTEALRLYLSALLQGCYRPRLGAIIFLQIFLNSRNYRALANAGIGWLRMGLRDTADRKRSSNKPLKIA